MARIPKAQQIKKFDKPTSAKEDQYIKKLSRPKPKEEVVEYDPSVQIHYTKLPGNMILIEGFDNILTRREITTRHGEQVAGIYFNEVCPISMCKEFDEDRMAHILIESNEEDSGIYISHGDVFSKKQFAEIRIAMKKCGNMLHEIIVALENNDTSTMKI